MWGAGLWEGWGAGLADLGYGLCSVMCRAGKWPLAGGGQSGSQFSQQGPRNVPSYPSCRGLGMEVQGPPGSLPCCSLPLCPSVPLVTVPGVGD